MTGLSTTANSGYQLGVVRWRDSVFFFAAAEKVSGFDPDPVTPFILLYQRKLFQLGDRFDEFGLHLCYVCPCMLIGVFISPQPVGDLFDPGFPAFPEPEEQ